MTERNLASSDLGPLGTAFVLALSVSPLGVPIGLLEALRQHRLGNDSQAASEVAMSMLFLRWLRLGRASEAGLIQLTTKESWANPNTLADHFARHGGDFAATSADDYARMASEFFQRGGAERYPTKIAPDGTIRMWDPATNTFGSFNPMGQTKTFFMPTSPTYWENQKGVLVP